MEWGKRETEKEMTINMELQNNDMKADMCIEYDKDKAKAKCYKEEWYEKRQREDLIIKITRQNNDMKADKGRACVEDGTKGDQEVIKWRGAKRIKRLDDNNSEAIE